MGRRRQAREACFKSLYRMQVIDEPATEAVTLLQQDGALDEETVGYAVHLITLVDLNHEEIDTLLAGHLQHWKLERLAQTDRAVLRMATAELLYVPDVPPRVAIDEAIEIARRYGTDASGRFVNGVLDSLAKARSVL